MKVPDIDTAKFGKLTLFFLGIALIAFGVFSLLVDLADNLRITQTHNFVPIAAGIVVLLITGTFYRLIPEYLRSRRYQALQAQYADSPSPATHAHRHCVTESAHKAFMSLEMAVDMCENNPKESLILLDQAKKNIDDLKADISRMQA